MLFLYFLIIAISFLPLIIFLIKRKRYQHVLKEGICIKAEVKQIKRRRVYRGGNYDTVIFWYLPVGSRQYYAGQLMAKPGKYRGGNLIEVFYLPNEPTKYAVPGKSYHKAFLLFLLMIIAFVVYACFKLEEMMGDQKIYFNP